MARMAFCMRMYSHRLPTSPDPRAVASSAVAESLSLSSSVPLLLRLRERPWAAWGSLPSDFLPSGEQPARIGVVRDAFAAHDQPVRPLTSLVRPITDAAVAVAADATDYATRVLVDVYARDEKTGAYRLERQADDLLRLLHGAGLRTLHVPRLDGSGASSLQKLNSVASASRGVRQSTNEVLMVAPTAFGFNAQAAQDNTFMQSTDASIDSAAGHEVTHAVLREFAGLHRELADVAGVRINLAQHSLAHGTPDACFPNNWFSTHAAAEAGGRSALVLYPMKCPNRQAEAREDIKSALRALGLAREIDLATQERGGSDGRGGRVLEGTGSLVLDRVNGVAYVALSERADASLAEEWAQRLGYREVVTFVSTDGAGGAVYHTNVMMAVGTDVAVVCLESVDDERERARLRAALERHHAIVDISRAQMAGMCGNVLELEDGRGLPVLAMSSQAHNTFTEDQRRLMRRHVAALHHAPIDTLERIGGGSVRCTLGEIFRN